MNPELSIIVPAYNEEARLGTSLEQIFEFVRSQGLRAEVIIVDDGSNDRTAETAETASSRARVGDGARVIRYEPNRGKGFAVRAGLAAARAPVALFTDADLSTPIDEMDKLLKPIRDGMMDVTFGSRALDRSLIGTHQPWRREQGGKVFNLVVRLSTGLPFWDTQCGFKAFRMSAFRPMLSLMRIDRFGFDVEFLYVARLHGLRLSEVPVRWNNDERSKVSIFRDSIRMFSEVLEIRRNARRGLYNTP